MTADLLRVYFDPAEIGDDGYPWQWHKGDLSPNSEGTIGHIPIKDQIRNRDGHRCLRCGHPYRKGKHGNGEWSPCDELCTHGGPVRVIRANGYAGTNGELLGRFPAPDGLEVARLAWPDEEIQAQWRILTVHHLNGVKHDCRWWNLVSLCQRCHLRVQRVVVMDRVWPWEHTDWFKPFAAGWYAWAYLGEDLTLEQTLARLDELLALEQAAWDAGSKP